MSQILSVASRAVRGKTGSRYEDLDGPNSQGDGGGDLAAQELEMNSVSIVPDGKFLELNPFIKHWTEA